MKAAAFAQILKLHNLPVKYFEEGEINFDGMVQITDLVSVSVSTFDSKIHVTAKSADGESFEFYPDRNAQDIKLIIADIRKACGFVG